MMDKDEIMKKLLENTQAVGRATRTLTKPILLPRIKDIMTSQNMSAGHTHRLPVTSPAHKELAKKIAGIMDLAKKAKKDE